MSLKVLRTFLSCNRFKRQNYCPAIICSLEAGGNKWQLLFVYFSLFCTCVQVLSGESLKKIKCAQKTLKKKLITEGNFEWYSKKP